MTENAFKKVFAQFLHNYWGAFHEALEAQSVTRRRLAGSLFEALVTEHRTFAAMYSGPADSAVEGLGGIWREITARRYQFADPALTQDDVAKARRLFEEIHDSLVREGRRFAAARDEILKQAPHGTPKEPLRADAAR